MAEKKKLDLFYGRGPLYELKCKTYHNWNLSRYLWNETAFEMESTNMSRIVEFFLS